MAGRLVLTVTALGFLALFLALPLVVVFSEALSLGFGHYVTAIADPNVAAAICSASSPPGASRASSSPGAICWSR
jgi:ABC-type sulfate transport system permease subunit